jgi:hypothetical protein
MVAVQKPGGVGNGLVWFGLVWFLGGNVVVGHILYEHTFTAILS